MFLIALCEYRLNGGSKTLYEHMIRKLQLSAVEASVTLVA